MILSILKWIVLIWFVFPGSVLMIVFYYYIFENLWKK